jgi:hypothetical protein
VNKTKQSEIKAKKNKLKQKEAKRCGARARVCSKAKEVPVCLRLLITVLSMLTASSTSAL